MCRSKPQPVQLATESELCRAGHHGKLHPVYLAGRFHSALQLWLARRQGGSVLSTPHFQMVMGRLSYAQARPGHALLCTMTGPAGTPSAPNWPAWPVLQQHSSVLCWSTRASHLCSCRLGGPCLPAGALELPTTEVQQLVIVGSRRACAAAGQGSVGQGPAPLLLRAGLAGRSSRRPHLAGSQHLDKAGVAVQHRLQLVVVCSDIQLSSSTAALCEAGEAGKHWQHIMCFQSTNAGLCASIGAVSSAQLPHMLSRCGGPVHRPSCWTSWE